MIITEREEKWIERWIDQFELVNGREPTDAEIDNYILECNSLYDDYIDNLIDEAKLGRAN